jgi:hypothetical protein
MGVYQRIFLEDSVSMRWILLHPPARAQEILERCSRQSGYYYQEDGRFRHPMTLHLAFITIAALDWKEYIEELHSRLRYFVSERLKFLENILF